MKKIFYPLLLVFCTQILNAQVSPGNQFVRIINLILQHNAKALGKMIIYPLRRQNPLPDIENAKQFEVYFDTLFDNDFKAKLKTFNASDVFVQDGQAGMVGGGFSGDVWINSDGKITGINHYSPQEIKTRNELTEKTQKQIFPAVNKWKENILVARSPKLLIRLDETDKGLRYVCWNNDFDISHQPNLVIYSDKTSAEHSQGGWTWIFNNGAWRYEVEKRQICADSQGCGLFLRLYYHDEPRAATRLTETK